MIRFIETRTEWFGPASFEIAPGTLAKAFAGSSEAAEGFVKTAAGLIKPLSGQVRLFGEDVHAVCEEDYIRLMARVGVAAESGGMISNLKVWENVALPALYHGTRTMEELEAFTGSAFASLGIGQEEGERLMRLSPSELKPWQGKILRLIRAYSADPDLVILEDAVSGLPGETQKNVIQLALRLHREKPGRATVFVCSDDSALTALPAAALNLGRSGAGDQGGK